MSILIYFPQAMLNELQITTTTAEGYQKSHMLSELIAYTILNILST